MKIAFSKSKLLITTALVAASVASTNAFAQNITLDYNEAIFTSGATWNGELHEVYSRVIAMGTTDTHNIYLTGVERNDTVDITTVVFGTDTTNVYGGDGSLIWNCSSVNEATTCNGGVYNTGDDPAASGNVSTVTAPITGNESINIGALTLNVSAASGAAPALGVVIGTTGTLNVSQAVTAQTIAIGSGALNVSGAGVLTVSTGSNTGVVTLSSGGELLLGNGVSGWTGAIEGAGTLTTQGTLMFDQAIGGVTALTNINAGYDYQTTTFNNTVTFTNDLSVIGTGTVVFNETISGGNVRFQGNGTITVASGKTISAGITTDNNGQGNLNLLGDFNFTNNIGTGVGDTINTLTLGGATSTVVLNGRLGAANVVLEGDNTLTVNNVAYLTGNVQGTGGEGTVTFNSGATVGGSVSGIKSLDALGTDTFSGVVSVSGDIDAAGDTTFETAVTAPVVNTTTGTTWFKGVTNIDTLNINGIGTVRFDQKLDTEAIVFNTAGTLDLNETYDHAINFGVANGTVTIADGKTLIGIIDSNVDNVGNLVVEGSSSFSNLIGNTHSIASVSVNNTAGQTATFGGAVKANTITSGDGDTVFVAPIDVQAIVVGGTGTLTLNEMISTSTSTISFSAAGTVQLNEVYSDAVDFSNIAGTVYIPNNVGFDGSVTSTGGINGTLQIAGSSAVGATFDNVDQISNVTLSGAAGNIVTFSNDVNATTLTLGDVDSAFSQDIAATTLVISAGNLAVNGNTAAVTSIALGAGSATFGGTVNTATLNLGSGTSIFGDTVTAVTTNSGSGDSTFNGVVNSTAFNQSTGNTSFNNNVAGNLVFTGSGTATIADAKTFTGSINADVSGQGTFDFAGSSSGITSIGTVNPLEVLRLSGIGKTVTVTGNIMSADTLSVGSSTLETTGGIFTIGSGQTFQADISSVTTSGQLVSAGAAIINANSVFEVGVNAAAFIPANTQYTIVDGVAAGGSVSTLSGGVGSNSMLVDFTQVANADDMVVRTSLVPTTDASLDGLTANGKTILEVLYDIGTTANTEISQVQGDMMSASTLAELQAVLDNNMPTVDGHEIKSVVNSSAQIQGLLDQRITDLRLVDNYSPKGFYGADYSGDSLQTYGFGSGVSGGSAPLKSGAWAQGFVNNVTQDRYQSVSGYQANTYGMAFGLDNSNVIEGGILGLAINFGQTTITSDADNGFETEIQNYGFSVYSNYTFDNAVFLNAQFGASLNDITGHRFDVGGVGNTATATYDNMQLVAKASFGRDTNVFGGVTTTSLFASTAGIETSGYTETGGGGGANLTVGDQSNQSLKVGANLKQSWVLMSKRGALFQPHVNLGYSYELNDDPVSTEVAFVGGGSTFTIEGQEIDPNTLNLGMGATYVDMNNWELSGAFDYSYREGYSSYTSLMKATSYF